MGRRFVRHVTMLVVGLATATAEAGPAAENWIHIVGADAAGLDLQLVAPEPGAAPAFEHLVAIGVPGPAGAEIRVLDEARMEVAPGEPIVVALRDGAISKPPQSSSIPIRITGTAILRGRYVVFLCFQPHAARVRLDYRDRAVPSTSAPRPDPMHRHLLNAAIAAEWPLAFSPPTPAARRRSLPAERLRIRIARRGVYELRGEDLLAAGVPITTPGFDPRTLRLYCDAWKPAVLMADSTPASWQSDYEMQEAAIWVQGEDDGTFDLLDDRLVFYALGPDGYLDLADPSVTDSLAHLEHPSDAHRFAWLTWGGGFGRRMSTAPAAAPEPLADPLVARVRHREHVEQNLRHTSTGDLWAWESISPTPRAVGFDLELGMDSTTADLRMVVAAPDGYGSMIIDCALNGNPLPQITWTTPSSPKAFEFRDVTLTALNRLEFSRDSASSGQAVLLELDARWNRPLRARANGTLEWSARPATSHEVYELSGFAAEPLVFDVTDASNPVRLTEPTAAASNWRVRAGRGAGVGAQYFAVEMAAPVDRAADLELRMINDLRSRTTSPEALIVTHESLRAAAERLAAYRASRFPGGGGAEVLVTTTRDIYDNFSGGRMDPVAIRNYIKFLYRLDAAEPRLRYVLLFGDATYDPRRWLASSPETLVPALYPLASDPRLTGRYEAVEDWFVEMDTPRNGVQSPQFASVFPVADLYVGRLPVSNAGEAERVVDKIIAYESTSNFGAWRGRILSASDDECEPYSGCMSTYWILNNEILLRQIPDRFDVEKLYLTEYTSVQGQKPPARRDFIRLWNQGAAVVNWNGHGAASQLADEALFLQADVAQLSNGSRLPLFLEFGDRGSVFDSTTDALYGPYLGEALLESTTGGAIGVISSTNHTFVGPSFQFNLQTLRALFPAEDPTPPALGALLHAAKTAAPASQGPFNESYTLLGDPMLVPALPALDVSFTTGADSLVAGRRAHVEGFVHARGDSVALASFHGTADIAVSGSADESGYTLPNSPVTHLDYDLPGATMFRGTTPVAHGRFAFDFTVPALAIERPDSLRVATGGRAATPDSVYSGSRRGLRFGPKARISVYAASASLDAKGARHDVVFAPATAALTSTSPPRIDVRFDGEPRAVLPGAPATIEIRDENGIAIAGAGAIQIQFDDRAALDVGAQFHCTSADTVGAVTVVVPADCAAGPHRIGVSARDNLGNPARASFDFEVQGTSATRLDNVLAFPNPFRDRTHVFFELQEQAEVELSIHATSGREVWRDRRHHDGGRGSIAWPGVDAAGAPLANGTYLYRLVVRPARSGAAALRRDGKLVVMR